MHKKRSKSTFSLALLAAISICSLTNSARAKTGSVTISEILINGPAGKEFIELYNPTDEAVDMSNWLLNYYSKDRDWGNPYRKNYFPADSILRPSEFFLISIKTDETLDESTWNLGYASYQLNNTDGAVGIFPDENFTKENAEDVFGWGEAKVGLFTGLSAPSEKSLEKINLLTDNNKENWQISCEAGGTPGEKSKECPVEPDLPATEDITPPAQANSPEDEDAEPSENYNLSDKIYLNEIFPNPQSDSDEEYIELKNGGEEPIDLYKWTIRDGSKSGKYFFNDHAIVDPGGYIAIYKSQSKLALNNSNESIYVYDPQNKLVSTASYDKSQKGVSYNFNGAVWKWSRYSTPGAKNKFDSEPIVKIKKPKNVYKDLLAKFSAKASDQETKELKYTWDFGDGKKSYTKETSHKYLDTGKYTVTLTVRDESQSIENTFTVNVKNFPRPDLEIMKIIPNPAGKDEIGEIVDIKNNSKKKVDLYGWKIATGSGKKMYNHPISEQFVINPGKTKTISRDISKFSLANKSGKVALVMPDGRIIDKIEYSKDKIDDDETYAKINGKWQWILNNSTGTTMDTETENEFIDDPTGEIESAESGGDEKDGEVLGATFDNDFARQPNFTSEDAYAFLRRIGFGMPSTKPNYCPMDDFPFSLAYLIASLIES